MAGFNNPSVIELENDSLRRRLTEIKTKTNIMIDMLERYLRQDLLRSELVSYKNYLKDFLK